MHCASFYGKKSDSTVTQALGPKRIVARLAWRQVVGEGSMLRTPVKKHLSPLDTRHANGAHMLVVFVHRYSLLLLDVSRLLVRSKACYHSMTLIH